MYIGGKTRGRLHHASLCVRCCCARRKSLSRGIYLLQRTFGRRKTSSGQGLLQPATSAATKHSNLSVGNQALAAMYEHPALHLTEGGQFPCNPKKKKKKKKTSVGRPAGGFTMHLFVCVVVAHDESHFREGLVAAHFRTPQNFERPGPSAASNFSSY